MTVGHEYCGTIVETGSEVRGFKEGDRVSGEGHITCGYCRNCKAGRQHLCRNTIGVGVNRPGAFAEFIALPAKNVFRLPPQVTDDHASFMDALGNAVHTALSFDLVGEDVLITGAGPIGCLAAAVCTHVGARHILITDVNDYRLSIATKCGATRVLNVSGLSQQQSVEEVRNVMNSLGMKEGWDVGLEMSGIESAFQTMLETMNNGGRIAILGIPSKPLHLNLDNIVFKGLLLKGIYGREMFETWYKMSNMLIGGLDKRIEPVITHRFKVDDYQKGFDAMLSGESGKVILDWN
jgi:threonine 3-dehydrogenase